MKHGLIKRLKTVACVFLTGVIILSLASCGTPRSRIDGYLDQTAPQYIMGRDISLSYDPSSLEEAKTLCDEILKIVAKGEEHYFSVSLKLRKFIMLVNKIAENYFYAEILKYTSPDTEYYDVAIELKAAIGELLSMHEELELKLGNSVYRNNYFIGMSEEEIDEYLNDLSPSQTLELSEKEEVVNALVAQYNTGEKTYEELFDEYLVASNAVAAVKGYADYLDYQNEEVYQREYTIGDSMPIIEYVAEYVVPAYSTLNLVYQLDLASLDSAELFEFNVMTNGFMGPYKTYFDDFAKYMGGAFWSNYKNLWRRGDYYFANNDRDDVTAFNWNYSSGRPFMLFSKNYQDIDTFSHEFGHYNAHFFTAGAPMDLAEVYSHSDEILFAQYLEENALVSEPLVRVYKNFVLRGILSNILQSTIAWSAQIYAYKTEGATAESVIDHAYTLYEQFGFTGLDRQRVENFIAYYVYNSPGYSISYVNSCFSSLGIYAEILNSGLDAAKDKYFDALYAYENDDTYTEVIREVGLFDPFNENDHKTVSGFWYFNA